MDIKKAVLKSFPLVLKKRKANFPLGKYRGTQFIKIGFRGEVSPSCGLLEYGHERLRNSYVFATLLGNGVQVGTRPMVLMKSNMEPETLRVCGEQECTLHGGVEPTLHTAALMGSLAPDYRVSVRNRKTRTRAQPSQLLTLGSLHNLFNLNFRNFL